MYIDIQVFYVVHTFIYLVLYMCTYNNTDDKRISLKKAIHSIRLSQNLIHQLRRSLLDSKYTDWIVHILLFLSQRLAAGFKLCERSSHASCLLGSKVKWLVFLLAIQFSQVFTLVVSDDCQHTGY